MVVTTTIPLPLATAHPRLPLDIMAQTRQISSTVSLLCCAVFFSVLAIDLTPFFLQPASTRTVITVEPTASLPLATDKPLMAPTSPIS